MEFGSHTVLVTGGGSGIGFAFAEKFLQEGSTVIICGRREEKLKEAQALHPQFHIRVCDASKASEREAGVDWATGEFPALDVLVNNAWIQQRLQLAQQPAWENLREELAINIDAPIHLSTLVIPHFIKQKNPAIVNITSGLSFVPLAIAPVYSATKAALHSFTLSLRHQLSGTPISVVEIIPPAVNTDLGGKGLHLTGTPLQEFTNAIIKQLKGGAIEASYGFSAQTSRASREELNVIFQRMNKAAH